MLTKSRMPYQASALVTKFFLKAASFIGELRGMECVQCPAYETRAALVHSKIRKETLLPMHATSRTPPAPHLRPDTAPDSRKRLGGRKERNAKCSLGVPIQELYQIKLLKMPWPLPWSPNSFLELWQLRCIPSTTDGFDEENAGIHTSLHDVDVIALICQQRCLRRDDLQIVVDATHVPIRKELKRL
jgi:hypothetical protein